MAKPQNNRYRLARQYDRQAAAAVLNAREQAREQMRAAYAAEEKVRAQHKRQLLAAWDRLTAGDTFTPGNNELTIKRKHAWSVTDTNGINWSMLEVIGLSREDAERLRATESEREELPMPEPQTMTRAGRTLRVGQHVTTPMGEGSIVDFDPDQREPLEVFVKLHSPRILGSKFWFAFHEVQGKEDRS